MIKFPWIPFMRKKRTYYVSEIFSLWTEDGLSVPVLKKAVKSVMPEHADEFFIIDLLRDGSSTVRMWRVLIAVGGDSLITTDHVNKLYDTGIFQYRHQRRSTHKASFSGKTAVGAPKVEVSLRWFSGLFPNHIKWVSHLPKNVTRYWRFQFRSYVDW